MAVFFLFLGLGFFGGWLLLRGGGGVVGSGGWCCVAGFLFWLGLVGLLAVGWWLVPVFLGVAWCLVPVSSVAGADASMLRLLRLLRLL